MIYLFLIILLLLSYIVYESVASRKEREKLQLKLMSKDVTEYTGVTEKEPELPDLTEKKEEFLEPEDVSTDKLLKANDTT